MGYLNEVWWSRFALPGVRLWSAATPPARLHEQVVAATDQDPKALACYGLWCDTQQAMLLRFVTGRPVSHVTTAFLEWTCGQLGEQGHRVMVLVWDNASWHVSAQVRGWLSAHNATVKQTGQGVRILVAGLPTKSPWLNKIEAKWKHGKEAMRGSGADADGGGSGRAGERVLRDGPAAALGAADGAETAEGGRRGVGETSAHPRPVPAQAVKTQQAT